MSRVIRVAWLVPAFPRNSADAHYPFLGREARDLAARPDIELIVLAESPAEPGAWPFPAIELHRPAARRAKAQLVTHAAKSQPRRLLRSALHAQREYPTLWRIERSLDALRSFRPDVVHSHFAVPGGTCGVPVARALDSAAVASLRGVDVTVEPAIGYGFRLDPHYDTELADGLANVDRCITATVQMRDRAIDAGAPAKRCRVVQNALGRLDPAAVPVVDRPECADQLIVSVGNLTVGKGFDRGLRALAELPPSVHYDIVGEGPERASLERLADDLQLRSRVRFLGSRPPLETRSRIANADCYWFLSRHEAFGNVIVEAFASDRRIVAAAEGVAPDLLRNEPLCHLLTDPDDPAELARATTALLGRADRLDRARALDAFRPEVWAEAVVEVYREAIAERSRR